MAVAGATSFFISVYVGRAVDATEFGSYSLILSLQGFVGLFAHLSIGTAMAKYVAENRVRSTSLAARTAQIGLTLVIVTSSAVSLIYFAMARVLGETVYNNPLVSTLIPFSAMAILGGSTFSVMLGIAQGCQRFNLLASARILSSITCFFAILTLVRLYGISGVFLGLFASQLGAAILLLGIINRKEFPVLGGANSKDRTHGMFKDILVFSLPLALATVVETAAFWIGNSELALWKGFDELAYFGVALFLYQALTMIPDALGTTVVPRIAQLNVASSDAIAGLSTRVLRSVSFLMFVPVFALCIYRGFVIEVTYGSKYSTSAIAVLLMAVASYIYSMDAVLRATLTGLGKSAVMLKLNSLWAITYLVLSPLAIWAFGSAGLAGVFVCSHGVRLAITMSISRSTAGVRVYSILPNIITAMFFLGVVLVLSLLMESQGFFLNTGLLVTGLLTMVWMNRDQVDEATRRGKAYLDSMIRKQAS